VRVFAENAMVYSGKFAPIPIIPLQKRPTMKNWQKYCTDLPTEKEIKEWMYKYGDCNIGIALGTKVSKNRQIACLDIDDEELIEPVLLALSGSGPKKKGKKGLTVFVLTDEVTTNHKYKRTGSNGKPVLKPSVELLAHGSQTVIPPSIHPDGMSYVWLEHDLFFPTSKWPFVSDAVLDEIAAICHNKAEHFSALNTMVWLGLGAGGNTHDVCVAAVACMVARGWSDSDIRDRIIRAKQNAALRSNLEYNWSEAETTIQEWTNSAREKGMSNRIQVKKLPLERVMADWAIAKLGGKENVVCVNGQLRRYEGGYWPLVDISGLMKAMYEFEESLREREAKSAISIAHTMSEVVGFGKTEDLEPRDDPKRQKICLQNGTLNLRTGELEIGAPEHELIHKLSFDWDDEAECHLYDQVVNQTFNNDIKAVQLWDEYCALSLVDDMSFQKLLFLRGPGGNGKGTLARVLRNLHDPKAVASVAITDLGDERKRTSLVGKLVNVSGEQSRLNLISDTYLKKITGGDPIDIRKLYGETQNNVVLSVRFLELVNEMPATFDSTYALRRRLIILDCPNKVKTPDPDLDRKLYLERPGILRRFTSALHRLYNRGHFDISDASGKEVDTYLLENDPVAYWLQDRIDPVPQKHKGTVSRELYADFKNWHELMGYRYPMPEVVWGRRLTGLGYPVIFTRMGKTHGRYRRLVIRAGHEARI